MKARKRLSRRSLGTHFRVTTLATLDGRTREAILMRRVRQELIAHCGGNPTITQKMLIERAVVLSLRVAQIDIKIMNGESFTTHDSNFALAWNNSLRRTLIELGVDAPKQKSRVPVDRHSLTGILHEAAE